MKFILTRVFQNVLTLSALGVLFFYVAGRIDGIGFWLYVITVLLYQGVSLLVIVPRYPAYQTLAQVRKVKRPDAKKWDRVILFLSMGAALIMYGLPAFDLGHLHWWELPWGWSVVGVILYVSGSALNQWAMLHNPHFEHEVRIQSDRGHQVIQSGPYRYIRHPGYLGSVLGFLSYPLIVGSAMGLLGSGLGIIGMVVRTYLEDRTLVQELNGYMEYAQTTRYRLFPWVW
jgi:protein-S-isoprenylcysteine O-methyltransferase Ste14